MTSVTGQPATETRPASGTDAPAIAETLAQAFADDPVVGWVVRDDEQRPAALRRLFTVEVDDALPYSEVYRTAAADGVAVWYPPDTWQTDPAAAEQLLPVYTQICGEQRLDRALALVDAMEQAHPRAPHRYLHWLGVAPHRQGQQLGSTLLQSMLRRCDADRLPAYLEATHPRNVRLYERHGFAVTGELTCPGDGPPLWQMWREPAADGV